MRGQLNWQGFTLIELMLVLAIASIVTVVALPSWHSVQDQSLIREARAVLQRLDLKQRQFWVRHRHYATVDQLPSLVSLSDRVAHFYRLRVFAGSGEYTLQLTTDTDRLPSIALNHQGVWIESSPGGAANVP